MNLVNEEVEIMGRGVWGRSKWGRVWWKGEIMGKVVWGIGIRIEIVVDVNGMEMIGGENVG